MKNRLSAIMLKWGLLLIPAFLITLFGAKSPVFADRMIVQLAAGGDYTLGLCDDNTVLTAGKLKGGERHIAQWRNAIDLAAGISHCLGLKKDGTVVAWGADWDGQCRLGDWSNLIQLAAGGYHTVGLKADGTVVAIG